MDGGSVEQARGHASDRKRERRRRARGEVGVEGERRGFSIEQLQALTRVAQADAGAAGRATEAHAIIGDREQQSACLLYTSRRG